MRTAARFAPLIACLLVVATPAPADPVTFTLDKQVYKHGEPIRITLQGQRVRYWGITIRPVYAPLDPVNVHTADVAGAKARGEFQQSPTYVLERPYPQRAVGVSDVSGVITVDSAKLPMPRDATYYGPDGFGAAYRNRGVWARDPSRGYFEAVFGEHDDAGQGQDRQRIRFFVYRPFAPQDEALTVPPVATVGSPLTVQVRAPRPGHLELVRLAHVVPGGALVPEHNLRPRGNFSFKIRQAGPLAHRFELDRCLAPGAYEVRLMDEKRDLIVARAPVTLGYPNWRGAVRVGDGRTSAHPSTSPPQIALRLPQQPSPEMVKGLQLRVLRVGPHGLLERRQQTISISSDALLAAARGTAARPILDRAMVPGTYEARLVCPASLYLTPATTPPSEAYVLDSVRFALEGALPPAQQFDRAPVDQPAPPRFAGVRLNLPKTEYDIGEPIVAVVANTGALTAQDGLTAALFYKDQHAAECVRRSGYVVGNATVEGGRAAFDKPDLMPLETGDYEILLFVAGAGGGGANSGHDRHRELVLANGLVGRKSVRVVARSVNVALAPANLTPDAELPLAGTTPSPPKPAITLVQIWRAGDVMPGGALRRATFGGTEIPGEEMPLLLKDPGERIDAKAKPFFASDNYEIRVFRGLKGALRPEFIGVGEGLQRERAEGALPLDSRTFKPAYMVGRQIVAVRDPGPPKLPNQALYRIPDIEQPGEGDPRQGIAANHPTAATCAREPVVVASGPQPAPPQPQPPAPSGERRAPGGRLNREGP